LAKIIGNRLKKTHHNADIKIETNSSSNAMVMYNLKSKGIDLNAPLLFFWE